MSYNIRLKIGNYDYVYFSFSFNNNYTSFEDLLEYVSELYPQYKICNCFKFSFSNNGQLTPIKNEDKISSYLPSIFNNLVINNHNKKCFCSPLLKELFQKSKKDIIYNSQEKINKLENDIENIRKEIKKKETEINK